MADVTVGDLKTSLTAWMRETVDDSVAFDAISDSIVSIWETLICISLSEFLGGPVQITVLPSSGLSVNMTTVDVAEADDPEGGDDGDADDIWYIHNMSVKMPDGTDRVWEGTEVGSELWRQFARHNAGSTPYSPYVYDFDGTKFSITPNVAQELTPGFFYIKRPPRTVDNDTVVPFHHPAAPMFIRYNSMSLLLLSIAEYIGSSTWARKAEEVRMSMIRSSSMKNVRKNLRVQPLFR